MSVGVMLSVLVSYFYLDLHDLDLHQSIGQSNVEAFSTCRFLNLHMTSLVAWLC